jgi:hypothetical protein
MDDYTNDLIVDQLNERHEVWIDNENTWEEIQDVLFDHVKNNLDRYIPRGEDEEPTDYSLRLRFARFKGELAPLIHRFIGAVMSRPPTRSDRIVREWSQFLDNCDGCQTPFDQFMEDRLFEAFGFGASAILIDRPMVDERGLVQETTSMGFEQATVTRQVESNEIIAVPYRISQVVNWSVDRCGEFHWVRLMEWQTRTESPLSDPQKVCVYREFDRSSWRVFEVAKDENGKERIVATSQGDHNLGIVPLAILYLQKEKPMSFYSPMRYAYQYDLTNFITDCDLQFAQWRFAYPLVKDSRMEERARRVTLGPGSTVKLNSDRNEDVQFEEIGGSGLDQLRKSKEEGVAGLRRLSGVDALSSSQHASSGIASGRSRAISFSISEERHLRRASRALQNCEKRVFEIAERWASDRQDIHPSESLNPDVAVYPMVFTSSGTEGLIEQWLTTRTQINSETYDRQMQIKIVDSALGDVGSATREKILEEIQGNDLVNSISDQGEAPPIDEFNPGSEVGEPEDQDGTGEDQARGLEDGERAASEAQTEE